MFFISPHQSREDLKAYLESGGENVQIKAYDTFVEELKQVRRIRATTAASFY